MVLLTGATGFPERYLGLEWLRRIELSDGTLICLVRSKSNSDTPSMATRPSLHGWPAARCAILEPIAPTGSGDILGADRLGGYRPGVVDDAGPRI